MPLVDLSIEGLLAYEGRNPRPADFDAYWDAQRSIDRLWLTPEDWWRKNILNTARMDWFSSDRSIREYARDIWNVPIG